MNLKNCICCIFIDLERHYSHDPFFKSTLAVFLAFKNVFEGVLPMLIIALWTSLSNASNHLMAGIKLIIEYLYYKVTGNEIAKAVMLSALNPKGEDWAEFLVSELKCHFPHPLSITQVQSSSCKLWSSPIGPSGTTEVDRV